MMAWGLPSVLPATSRTPPASAGGLFFALDGRHPLAFELACPLQDRVFELGLDLSGDGGLEPVSVSEARLARYGHRQRVRTQCSSQDENVNLVALVWLATGSGLRCSRSVGPGSVAILSWPDPAPSRSSPRYRFLWVRSSKPVGHSRCPADRSTRFRRTPRGPTKDLRQRRPTSGNGQRASRDPRRNGVLAAWSQERVLCQEWSSYGRVYRRQSCRRPQPDRSRRAGCRTGG